MLFCNYKDYFEVDRANYFWMWKCWPRSFFNSGLYVKRLILMCSNILRAGEIKKRAVLTHCTSTSERWVGRHALCQDESRAGTHCVKRCHTRCYTFMHDNTGLKIIHSLYRMSEMNIVCFYILNEFGARPCHFKIESPLRRCGWRSASIVCAAFEGSFKKRNGICTK